MADPSFLVKAKTRYPASNVEALAFLQGDPTRLEDDLERTAFLKQNRQMQLLSEHHGKAIFSTSHGLRPKRPCYRGQPKIIKSHYLEDVLHEATRLQEMFPDDCKRLSPDSLVTDLVGQQQYFDNFDIHYFGEVFLFHVLGNIAHANVIDQARRVEPVNDFAYSWIQTNPKAFRLFSEHHQWSDLFCHADVDHYGQNFLQDAFWKIANIRDEAAQAARKSFSAYPAPSSELTISPRRQRRFSDSKQKPAPRLTIDTSAGLTRQQEKNRPLTSSRPTSAALASQLPYLMAPAGLEYPLGMLSRPEEATLGLATVEIPHRPTNNRSFADHRMEGFHNPLYLEQPLPPMGQYPTHDAPRVSQSRRDSHRYGSSDHNTQMRHQRGNYSTQNQGRPGYANKSMRGGRNPTKTSTDDARFFDANPDDCFRGQFSPQKDRRFSFQKYNDYNGQPRLFDYRDGNSPRKFDKSRVNNDFEHDRRFASNPYLENNRPARGTGSQSNIISTHRPFQPEYGSPSQTIRGGGRHLMAPPGFAPRPQRAHQSLEAIFTPSNQAHKKPGQFESAWKDIEGLGKISLTSLPQDVSTQELASELKGFTGYRSIHMFERNTTTGTPLALATFGTDQEAAIALPGLKEVPLLKNHGVVVQLMVSETEFLALAGTMLNSSSQGRTTPLNQPEQRTSPTDHSSERKPVVFKPRAEVRSPNNDSPKTGDPIKADTSRSQIYLTAFKETELDEVGNTHKKSLCGQNEASPGQKSVKPEIESMGDSLVLARKRPADRDSMSEQEPANEATKAKSMGVTHDQISTQAESLQPFKSSGEFPTLAESVKQKKKSAGRKKHVQKQQPKQEKSTRQMTDQNVSLDHDSEPKPGFSGEGESSTRETQQQPSRARFSGGVNEAIVKASHDDQVRETGPAFVLDQQIHNKREGLMIEAKTNQNIQPLDMTTMEPIHRDGNLTDTDVSPPGSPQVATGTTLPSTPNEIGHAEEVHGVKSMSNDSNNLNANKSSSSRDDVRGENSSFLSNGQMGLDAPLPIVSTNMRPLAHTTPDQPMKGPSPDDKSQSYTMATVTNLGSVHPVIPTRKKKARTKPSTPTKKSLSGVSLTKALQASSEALPAPKRDYPKITEDFVTVLHPSVNDNDEPTSRSHYRNSTFHEGSMRGINASSLQPDSSTPEVWACERPWEIKDPNHGKSLREVIVQHHSWPLILAEEKEAEVAHVLSSGLQGAESISTDMQIFHELYVTSYDHYVDTELGKYRALEAKLEAIEMSEDLESTARTARHILQHMPIRSRHGSNEGVPLPRIVSWTATMQEWIEGVPDNLAFRVSVMAEIMSEASELDGILTTMKNKYMEGYSVDFRMPQGRSCRDIAFEAENVHVKSPRQKNPHLTDLPLARQELQWILYVQSFLGHLRRLGYLNEEKELPAELLAELRKHSRTEVAERLVSKHATMIRDIIPVASRQSRDDKSNRGPPARLIENDLSQGIVTIDTLRELDVRIKHGEQAKREMEAEELKDKIRKADRQLKQQSLLKLNLTLDQASETNLTTQEQQGLQDKGCGYVEEDRKMGEKANAKAKSKNKKKKAKGKKVYLSLTDAPSGSASLDHVKKQDAGNSPAQKQAAVDETRSPSLHASALGVVASTGSTRTSQKTEVPESNGSATNDSMQPNELANYTEVTELLGNKTVEKEEDFRARIEKLHQTENLIAKSALTRDQRMVPNVVKENDRPAQMSWAQKASQGQEPKKEAQNLSLTLDTTTTTTANNSSQSRSRASSTLSSVSAATMQPRPASVIGVTRPRSPWVVPLEEAVWASSKNARADGNGRGARSQSVISGRGQGGKMGPKRGDR